MNVFEGSRRIATVIACAGVLISAVVTYNKTPYVHFKSYLVAPDYKLKEVADCMGGPTQTLKVPHEGATVYVTLCTGLLTPSAVSLPKKDAEELDKAVAARRWADIKESIGYTGLSLMAWLAFTNILGWIVRGFLGIPSGMDSRPQEAASTSP